MRIERSHGTTAAMSASLSEVLDSHKVVVTVGSGGVGKTTTAAAIALHAAMSGKRVLCMTIDPARRLANSLGLESVTASQQLVDGALFERFGLSATGELQAMMLDARDTFDKLVIKSASSPESAQKILDNRIYQQMASGLAGTQEYMAMEKLYSVREEEDFDLIVLDTPPTSNALDFLDAPERLVGMIDSPAMRWFVGAFEQKGRFGFSLFGKGASLVFKALARFTGAGFLEDIAEFVSGLNDIFGSFRARAEAVSGALRTEEVAFVVVTSPAALAIEEAIYFSGKLAELGMQRDAVVVNGMHALHAEPSMSTREQKELIATEVTGGDADAASALLTKMQQALDDERERAVADRLESDRLRNSLDKQTLFVEVPQLDGDVHDLGALARIASYLVAKGAH